jgi:serine/threonine-protein phosphatase 2A regulatory subunit B'
VSAEAPDALRAGHYSGAPERHPLNDHGGAIPPRATTLNRLRAGPKDTIPMVGKPPRKQRSSRFVVTERVDIERLPPFMGKFGHLIY